MARLAMTRFAAATAIAGALVMAAAAADPAFASPYSCSFRLDSLPVSLPAGGSPAAFSGAMVNETGERTFAHTVLILTVKLSGLTPERLRIERETVDAQWVTLPIDAAGSGQIKAVDNAYQNVDIAPGAVAGGRYRMAFAAGAPTGSASVTMEGYPSDNRTAAAMLGRSSAYPLTVTPPAPPGPSAAVAPQDPVPESGTGGLAGAVEATGPTGDRRGSDVPSGTTTAAAVDQQAAPADNASRTSGVLSRWMSIALGALAVLVLLAGVAWWIVRRQARW